MKDRILGLDFGMARVGFAISDPNKIVASPLHTLEVGGGWEKIVVMCAEYIQKICHENKYVISQIVVGLPLRMNGTESESTKTVQLFAKSLEEALKIPVELFDERLTTVQAERSLKDAGFTRKKRTKYIDRLSAVILLRSFLDLKIKHI